MTDAERRSFKSRLRAGDSLIGVRAQSCSPLVVEALGWCGFDYAYIDMEHAPNDLMSALAQCHALGECTAEPVVRMPRHDPTLLQQMLDLRIDNIVVPMIETPEVAKEAVAASRFPPRGVRSVAKIHRGNRFGSIPDYEATMDDRICLVVQIESRRGLDRISDIAALDGAEGLLFGPSDLAADMRHIGKVEHPEVTRAMSDAIPKILAAGKFAGMSTGNAASVPSWLEQGCRFISVTGHLQMLAAAARKASSTARGIS